MSTATWSTGYTARPAVSRRVASAAPTMERSAAPKLHLTRRGRAVLTFLVAAPLVVAAFLFVVNGGGATASLEGSDAAFQYVTVQPGESLWQLAEQLAPGADPRDVISDIVTFNQLDSADIAAGQELAIPSQYAH